jgi:crotonobetainyl-CoA:carnitine CoA-transferase CaiB-like acyl-CoA transferase
MSQLPLEGLRVLDLTRVLAGPLATMRLGDLGAEVIKIEHAGTGDESRGWGPPFDTRGESAYYLCCNRNKLSVGVDFNLAADAELIRTLIANADVVIDNFLPGALARRGLDPAALTAAHPKLVWCTITGFGADSGRPGYDYVVQAEAGWMSITGEVNGEPMRTCTALVDVLAGKDALTAVLATLTGVRAGLHVDRHVFVSLYHTAASALINVAQNALVSGLEPARMGNAHANLVPYQLFHAADGPLVVAVGNDGQFASVVKAFGVPELADARFATNAGRVTHRAEVVGLMSRHIAERPVAHWVDAFRKDGVPAGAVRRVRDVLKDVAASPLTGIPPFPPGTVRRPPPRLDEHGALVRAHGWNAFAQG